MRAKIFTIWLLAFVLGSMAAPLFESTPTVYLILGLVFVASSFFVYHKRYFFAVIFAFGILFLSISSFQHKEADLVAQNENFPGRELNFVAYVSDVPTINEYGQTVEIVTKTIDGKAFDVKLKGYAANYPRLEYGQIVKFRASIKPYDDKKWRLAKDGFAGSFSLDDYTVAGKQQGLWVEAKGLMFLVRNAFNEAISRSLPSAESGLASGLILGEKALLTPELTRQLQISGTTHIIALSGYNITIILGLFALLRSRFSRLANLLIPIAFIAFFVVMTGGAPSLVRAAIMGFMPLLAAYLGREGDSFIAILFSATIMIAINPFLTLFDVGFQLSFTALLGMIYLAPIIGKLFAALPEYLSKPLSETLGAQLMAMPILAYYFGSISLISPISNIIILSLVPAGMLVSFIVGFFGIIWQTLGNFFAIPAYALLHTINVLISFFGNLPSASQTIKIENPIWILMIYLLIFDFWMLLHKLGAHKPPVNDDL